MTAPGADLLNMLAYRMEAIAIGHLALRLHMSWKVVPSMEIYVDGKHVIEGKATGFTNAAIESAIIHSRAVLEFLGLMYSKKSPTAISERPTRTGADDHGVEKFAGLSMLTRAKALAAYPGASAEAEQALLLIFHLANKGLAHNTMSFNRESGDARLLEIAFRGVPVLLVNGFYAPLGMAPPAYEVASRPRTS